ncbi:DUF5953 family protein [Myxococcus xanthus]|uniref:DUF5953 family protein n=1 Tax=Myxococcus xanthus TaxID=34 RepID=UPI001CECC3F4|nr:DUF5953 family protein [Myxococcus xanthus]
MGPPLLAIEAGVDIPFKERRQTRQDLLDARGEPAAHVLPPCPKVIGLPAPARDADLLSRARRTATGDWFVHLTDAPLVRNNPAHVGVLVRTDERFPEIGGPAAP